MVTKKQKIVGLIAGLCLVLLAPVSALAQTTTNSQPAGNSLQAANCFDYYHFNSVGVGVTPVNKQLPAGSTQVFQGFITNDNPYPVLDGAVYVKIFRKSNTKNPQGNGYPIVDQFFAVKDINIKAETSLPVSFEWKVPAYAENGEYYASPYFVSQDKFNLLGLSFTDDITGGVVPFEVFGGSSSVVRTDKNSVKIDDKPYTFIGFIPTVDAKNPVSISYDIANGKSTPEDVKITYELYHWDGLQASQLVAKSEENVSLSARSSKTLKYEVKDNAHPVYYLVIKAENRGALSVMNVRFARAGVDWPRINFLGSNAYPLKEGVPTNIFACVHNANNHDMKDGRVVMTLLNSRGKEVVKKEYAGTITRSVMGFADVFIAKKDMADYTVRVDVYEKGELADSASMKYSCDILAPDSCPTTVFDTLASNKLLSLSILVAIIMIAGLALVLYKRRARPIQNDILSLFILSSIVGIMTIAGLSAPEKASATLDPNATTPLSLTYPPSNYVVRTWNTPSAALLGPNLPMSAAGYYPVWGGKCADGFTFVSGAPTAAGEDMCETHGGWAPSESHVTIDSAFVQWLFGVTATINGAPATGGETVYVGDIVEIKSLPHIREHISWTASGGTNDTPYGYWSTAWDDSYACNESNFIGDQSVIYQTGLSSYTSRNHRAYFPVKVSTPTFTTTKTGTAPTTLLAPGRYRVDGTGTLSLSGRYSNYSVSGQIWYKADPDPTVCRLHDFDSARFSGSQVLVTIPLAFNVSAAANTPPTSPTITPDACVEVNQPANFRFSASDPEGQMIKFKVSVDLEEPPTNTPYTANIYDYGRTFNTTGMKNMRVWTEDASGALSGTTEVNFEVKDFCLPAPGVVADTYAPVVVAGDAGKISVSIANNTGDPSATHTLEVYDPLNNPLPSIKVGSGATWVLPATLAVADLNFVATELNPSDNYRFRAKASLMGKNSSWADDDAPASVHIPGACPTLDLEIDSDLIANPLYTDPNTITIVEGSSVKLKWTTTNIGAENCSVFDWGANYSAGIVPCSSGVRTTDPIFAGPYSANRNPRITFNNVPATCSILEDQVTVNVIGMPFSLTAVPENVELKYIVGAKGEIKTFPIDINLTINGSTAWDKPIQFKQSEAYAIDLGTGATTTKITVSYPSTVEERVQSSSTGGSTYDIPVEATVSTPENDPAVPGNYRVFIKATSMGVETSKAVNVRVIKIDPGFEEF